MTEDTQEFVADAGFWDEVEQEAGAAEDFSVKASFGQITVTPNRYIKWTDGQPSDVTPQEFAVLPSKNRSLELKFTVNTQEFRPHLEWVYTRDVRIGGGDWFKVVRPSIEAVMGKGSMSKGKYHLTLQKLNSQYVEIHDVPKTKKEEEGYNTIQLVKVFPSRDACFAAWQERYGDDSESGAPVASANVPNGWEEASWNEQKPAIKVRLANGEEASVIATSYGITEVTYIEACR